MPNNPRRVSLCDIVQIAEHGLNRRIFEGCRNPGQHPIVREKVVTVNEAEDVTIGVPYALVQGVINPFVGLANQPHPVMTRALNGRQ